jgi:peptidylprolyl isomerase
MDQLYMVFRIIVYTSSMKKSQKIKGKEVVAARKKKQVRYGIVAVAGIIIIAICWFVIFNPFVAKAGDTVTVYYTGTLDDGSVFDTNVNATPLTFTVGKGMVIPGFEEAVSGMAVNEEKMVRIPADKAYGSYNRSLVHVLNRSVLPANMTPVVGQFFTIRSTIDGTASVVKIINVTPSAITLDENHALVGKNLTFSIKIVAINKK